MDFSEIRDEDEVEALERRPGCLRATRRVCLFLLVAVLFTVMLIPTLLSTTAGRLWAAANINRAIAPAQVSCENWSLGWFTPQVFNNVSYVNRDRGIDLSIQQIKVDKGLCRFLPVGDFDVGTVILKTPEIALDLIKLGQKSEARPQKKRSSAERGGFFLPVIDMGGTLVIDRGSAKVIGNSSEAFMARGVAATVVVASIRKPVTVKAELQTGGGTLSLEGRMQSLMELCKDGDFEEPETLTLTLAAVDLTALSPVIQHYTGAPWIKSGLADGALKAQVKGKERFALNGGIMVERLSVAGPGRAPSPKGDVALMIDVEYEERTIQITKCAFSSPWVRADASGTLKAGDPKGKLAGAIQAKAAAHLTAIVRDFAPVLGLSKGFEMRKGELNASFCLSGGDEGLLVDSTASASDLAMVIDGEPLALKPEPSLVFKAKFPYGALPEVETLHLKLPFADVYGSGRFDSAVLKARLDLTLFSRDFKRVLKSSPPMVGSAYLDLSTKRSDAGVTLTSFVKLSDLAAEFKPGQRIVIPQGTIKGCGLIPLSKNRPLHEIQDAVFDCTLESGIVKGGWKRLSLHQSGSGPVLRGFTVSGDFELGCVRRLIGGFMPVAVQRGMNTWQGHLIANATAEAAGGVVKARMNAAGQKIVASGTNGTWRVPDIRFDGSITKPAPGQGLRVEMTVSGAGSLERDGETVFAEPSAQGGVSATLAPDYSSVKADKVLLRSGLVELDAVADLTELATRRMLNAKGQVAVDFSRVTSLLAAKGINAFELNGRDAREFQLHTPLAGGLPTVLAEGELSGAVFISSLKGLGLNAGPADASVRLSKGILKMAYAPALNGGKLCLVPELDASGRVHTLSMPPQTRVLENVALTQDMLDTLLLSLSPMFRGSTVLGGTVSVVTRDCRMIPDVKPEQRVRVDLDMLFNGLKLGMGPALSELAALIKVTSKVYEVDRLPVHVVIKEGRVYVDPVKLSLDGQPVVFSGWVGLDGTINYLIEVTVTERLVGAGAAAQLLKGTVIKIPVSGNVNNPKLDASLLQSVLGSLLKGAVGEQAMEKVGGFLDKLQQELRK